jgi:hypothetical protein
MLSSARLEIKNAFRDGGGGAKGEGVKYVIVVGMSSMKLPRKQRNRADG